MMRQHAVQEVELVDFATVCVGESLPAVHFCVDAGSAAAYAQATSSGDEVCRHAPPLALVAFALAAMTDTMPLPPSTIHVGQDAAFTSAVPIGATVTACFALQSRRRILEQFVSVFSFVLETEDRECGNGRVVLRTSATDLGLNDDRPGQP